jgi:hypothetical protein
LNALVHSSDAPLPVFPRPTPSTLKRGLEGSLLEYSDNQQISKRPMVSESMRLVAEV